MFHLIYFITSGSLVSWFAHYQLDGGRSRLKTDIAAGVTGSLVSGIIVISLRIPEISPGINVTDIVLGGAGALMGIFSIRVIRSKRRR